MKQVRTVSDEQGMTQIAMLSRLMEWFLAQDETTRSAVMHGFSEELRRDVAKQIVGRLANRK